LPVQTVSWPAETQQLSRCWSVRHWQKSLYAGPCPARYGPLMAPVGRIWKWAACGLAGLILLAAGGWAGRSMHASTAMPRIEQGTVTFFGRDHSADGSQFRVRLDGSSKTQVFELTNAVEWNSGQDTTWNFGTTPSCMAPRQGGKRTRSGFEDAPITFGVVHTTAPDGNSAGRDVVVWVECPN